jgi:hypothetical protein
LLAPLHAAVERIVTRGPENLSVVVRFEQGGSLSLQLTLREGSIAAHMQTDVPGLEAALRSSWNSFAQDWNQRGVKLAAPTFGDGQPTDLTHGRDGQRSPQHEGHGFADQEAPSFAAMFGRRSWRSAHRSFDPGPAEAAAHKIASARRADRGLRTWA